MSRWSIRRTSKKGAIAVTVAVGVLVSGGAAVAFAAAPGANPSAPGLANKHPDSPQVIGNLHVEGTTDNPQTPMDIPLYRTDSATTAPTSSQSGGAGSGKVTFSPLVVSLPADQTISTLLQDEVNSAPLNLVVTLFAPGTQTAKLTETFSLATVHSQEIKGTADGLFQIVTFEYGAVRYTVAS